tara:strand:- start:2001 stop:2345 length:345 start_codon:yes stop_codon:yes gene_type:complete
MVDGEYPIWDFNSNDDIWKAIDLLKQEVFDMKEQGKEFNLASSIYAQIPFFACKNSIYSREAQRDIQRYLYCNESGIPAYKGSYGEQPAKWVDKFFLIKKILANKEKDKNGRPS